MDLARKTDAEKLKELEEKMKQIKIEQQKVANRLKQKERKERTKRLIEVGALIEKHFEIKGKDETIKLIYSYRESVKNNKDKILGVEIEKAKAELGEE